MSDELTDILRAANEAGFSISRLEPDRLYVKAHTYKSDILVSISIECHIGLSGRMIREFFKPFEQRMKELE